MKKQTKPTEKSQSLLNRWIATARHAVQAARQGKPKGELNQLIRMSAEWSKIPNTLYEDEAGNLWLAFTKQGEPGCPGAIDEEGGFEAVSVETALDWLQHVSEFTDGHDGDVADVCRIALAELARRPSYVDMVKRAVMEEMQARTKPRRARAVKSH